VAGAAARSFMNKNIQAIRGMNDILPEEAKFWTFLDSAVGGLFAGYGYGNMRLPVVEATQLFNRSIGEVTDIVAREMYTFPDRNGDSLTLRPEATAGIVRAAIEHSLLHDGPKKVWTSGPMFLLSGRRRDDIGNPSDRRRGSRFRWAGCRCRADRHARPFVEAARHHRCGAAYQLP